LIKLAYIGSGISAKSKPLVVFYYYTILDLALIPNGLTNFRIGKPINEIHVQYNIGDILNNIIK